MSGRTSANGPDPYSERLGKYWVGVRRRAWFIALVFTVLGEGIVIAATRTALPILATAPLTYLLMVFVLRLGARYGIASTGYRERDFAAEKEEPDRNRIGDVMGRREDLSVHRSRIFVFGGLLLSGILGMAVLLWSEGARDHVGPVSLGLIGVFFTRGNGLVRSSSVANLRSIACCGIDPGPRWVELWRGCRFVSCLDVRWFQRRSGCVRVRFGAY